MAIFRCNQCGHLQEVSHQHIGKSVKCPKCKNSARIHDTLEFLNALIKKNVAQGKALQEARKALEKQSPKQAPVCHTSSQAIDIHNTNHLSQAQHFEPIIEWFKQRNIAVEVNPQAVDTTGFFDEIALQLGHNFEVLSFVSNQIKYVQNKGYENVKIDLANKSKDETQQIADFCAALYDCSFVSRYKHHQKDKIIRLTLQAAPKIRAFFNGIWMEWFALVQLLTLFRDKGISPACARNLKVSFSLKDSNELDLFVLTKHGTPIYVECKTGEFRQDINKYIDLKKKLKMGKNQFVICVFGLAEEKARGMSSMYDLTFVNERCLLQHIQTII